MTKIRIYYPPDEVDRTEIDELAGTLRAVDGVDAVHLVGRRQLDWTQLMIVISVATLFVASRFFGKLVDELAGYTWEAIKAKIEGLTLSKLKDSPLTIEVWIEDDGTEVSFNLDTKSIDHLRNGLAVLPMLFKRLLDKMVEGRPSGVKSIRVDPNANSGKFELAVGRDERGRPIYVYSFEQNIWKPVRH